jgi:hypothetical protein
MRLLPQTAWCSQERPWLGSSMSTVSTTTPRGWVAMAFGGFPYT